MNKFGFKTFVSVSLPRVPTPKRPFDKTKDFAESMKGLWAYGTSMGLVASRRTQQIVPIHFDSYAAGGEGMSALVMVNNRRWTVVSTDRIFTAAERPNE